MTDPAYETTIITRPCPECQRTNEVEVKVEDYVSWRNGMHIQHAFPYLNSDDREVLMTGICPECWDTLYLNDY